MLPGVSAVPRRIAGCAGLPVTRAAVRESALHLFAERGYQLTTMVDIGAALGIRGPSLLQARRLQAGAARRDHDRDDDDADRPPAARPSTQAARLTCNFAVR